MSHMPFVFKMLQRKLNKNPLIFNEVMNKMSWIFLFTHPE